MDNWNIEIDKIHGIIGQTIAYQYNTTLERILKIIELRIDNNINLVFKIWENNGEVIKIKTREDLEIFKKEI